MTWIFDTTNSRTHKVIVDGEELTFAEAHSQFGRADSDRVRERLKSGWDVKKAFTTPAKDEGWYALPMRERILAIRNMFDTGMSLEAILARIGGDMSRQGLINFCSRNKISYANPRRSDVDTTVRPADGYGLREWSRSVDPKTTPREGGVAFAETNNSTCRWPMWDEPVGPASERPCCGRRTAEESVYCAEHTARTRPGWKGPDDGQEKLPATGAA